MGILSKTIMNLLNKKIIFLTLLSKIFITWSSSSSKCSSIGGVNTVSEEFQHQDVFWRSNHNHKKLPTTFILDRQQQHQCSIDSEENPDCSTKILSISRGGGGDSIGETATCNNNLLPPAVASVLAGSIAGAVGVGVAFPLDKLKTKSQVLSS